MSVDEEPKKKPPIVYATGTISLLSSFYPFLLLLDFLRSSMQLMKEPYPVIMAFFFFPAALVEVFFCFAVFRLYRYFFLKRFLAVWFTLISGTQLLLSSAFVALRSRLVMRHLGIEIADIGEILGKYVADLPGIFCICGVAVYVFSFFLYLSRKKGKF